MSEEGKGEATADKVLSNDGAIGQARLSFRASDLSLGSTVQGTPPQLNPFLYRTT